MLERCQSAQERFNGVHQLVDRWLHERSKLVSAYAAVIDQQRNPKRGPQKEFCQLLVDYVSAGHFEIYEQLNEEAKAFNDERGLALAETIYPRINVITEAALAGIIPRRLPITAASRWLQTVIAKSVARRATPFAIGTVCRQGN